MTWLELPWLSRSESTGTTVQLCDRLLRHGAAWKDVKGFLRDELPEIGTEFSVRWTAVARRSPEWQIDVECGRRTSGPLPYDLLEDALDREAAVFTPGDEATEGLPLLACPCGGDRTDTAVLLLSGVGLTAEIEGGV